jgi:hypothetical protein
MIKITFGYEDRITTLEIKSHSDIKMTIKQEPIGTELKLGGWIREQRISYRQLKRVLRGLVKDIKREFWRDKSVIDLTDIPYVEVDKVGE